MLPGTGAHAPGRQAGPVAPLRLALLLGSAGLLASACAAGQQAEEIQQVKVTGSADAAERRFANAARFVLNREDLTRFADTSLADVLRRVPGVTVAGAGTEAGDIRLRGLGAGYTRILVNGEPLPDGFSLSSLSPQVIDRVEVIRSATADMSTQAIAGTINIVLKRSVAPAERSMKVHAATHHGMGSGGITGLAGARQGANSYALSGSLDYERNRLPSLTALQSRSAQDSVFRRTTDTVENNAQWKLDAVPRYSWQPAPGQQLDVDALLRLQHLRYRYDDTRRDIAGTPPSFLSDTLGLVNDVAQLRAAVQWKSPVGDAGRFDAKVTLSGNRRTSDALLTGRGAASETILARTIGSELRDNSLIAVGKYALGWRDGHTLSTGWDGQYVRRGENRIQRETSATGFPTQDLDEDYDATVSRLALYAQDEWELSPRLSGYVGLRWERLATRTVGRGIQPASNRFSVASPTFQLLWKLPSSKTDQLRVALGRTYKAPTAKDLIPRRWVVTDNSASTPNFQGNPELRPELSWGLDVGLEHYIGNGGFAGINLYARRIDNVLLERVYNDRGTWVVTPANNGQARVYGMELELKAKLRELSRSAPDVDLRAGLTANRSSVANVPGPDNRIGLQAPLTAAMGIDYRLPAQGVTTGASFNIEKPAAYRPSIIQWSRAGVKRKLDVYGLYQVNDTAQLRVTLANLAGAGETSETRYDDGVLAQRQVVQAPAHRTLRVQLDIRL